MNQDKPEFKISVDEDELAKQKLMESFDEMFKSLLILGTKPGETRTQLKGVLDVFSKHGIDAITAMSILSELNNVFNGLEKDKEAEK